MRPSRMIAMTLGAVLLGDVAMAQMQNRPFAFRNSGPGGVGMSVGGKQAILNQEFTGAQPEVLVRDASGQLLDVRRGRDGLAIVREPGGGNFIPGFRGSGFRAGAVGMSVGAFNAFFVPRRGSNLSFLPMQASSTETVTVWTARVVTDSSVMSGRNNPVDIWTGYVFTLPVAR